ncbi:hypothetical protein [Bradyrhizobium vignae]|uniref:Uncharacterized protein n=1 Tax=Bradyrhizobium vignae TaxID=1549949 RepID=A0ABS4A1S3_9BRAD|nr:hypothetical protein [Bradyrhizobium vignae]MBP0114355.1 hypothetical protein [Bradyrhizobium vignae]
MSLIARGSPAEIEKQSHRFVNSIVTTLQLFVAPGPVGADFPRAASASLKQN